MRKRTLMRIEHILVIWNCIRIKGEVLRDWKVFKAPPTLKSFFPDRSKVIPLMGLWFHKWRLFFHYLFLFCPSLGASGGRCFVTITKTYLYNFDSFKPHLYIVKLGITGLYIIFHISAQNIDFGYSLEPPRREIWKISEFLSENLQFWWRNIQLIWIGVFS